MLRNMSRLFSSKSNHLVSSNKINALQSMSNRNFATQNSSLALANRNDYSNQNSYQRYIPYTQNIAPMLLAGIVSAGMFSVAYAEETKLPSDEEFIDKYGKDNNFYTLDLFQKLKLSLAQIERSYDIDELTYHATGLIKALPTEGEMFEQNAEQLEFQLRLIVDVQKQIAKKNNKKQSTMLLEQVTEYLNERKKLIGKELILQGRIKENSELLRDISKELDQTIAEKLLNALSFFVATPTRLGITTSIITGLATSALYYSGYLSGYWAVRIPVVSGTTVYKGHEIYLSIHDEKAWNEFKQTNEYFFANAIFGLVVEWVMTDIGNALIGAKTDSQLKELSTKPSIDEQRLNKLSEILKTNGKTLPGSDVEKQENIMLLYTTLKQWALKKASTDEKGLRGILDKNIGGLTSELSDNYSISKKLRQQLEQVAATSSAGLATNILSMRMGAAATA